MRTLIFGANGQLGRDLARLFARFGTVHGVDLPEVDIVAPGAADAVAASFKPDLVVNAAAYTDVEGAEDHAEAAFAVNRDGAGHVAAAAGALGTPVVYYSTDFVFDGTKGAPYVPEDVTAPLSVYAASKAAGEQATRARNPRHFVVRTAWLYGPGGNNFVEKILRAAAARPELAVVEDETGSPTHTYDLAEATAALVRTEAWGVYHVVNAGACSRYEFAREILRLAGLATPVRPCKASDYPAKARRPVCAILSNERFEAVTGCVMRDWRGALKHYIERRQQHP